MNSKRTAWLVWVLCGVVFAGALFSLVLTLNQGETRNDPFRVATEVFSAAAAIAFGVVGALILSRLARNRIGWLLMIIGVSWSVVGSLQSYLGRSGSVPAEPTTMTYLAIWLIGWSWWLLIGPLLLILLLFPTARLLSHRWRSLVAMITLLFAAFVVIATLSPEWSDPSTGASLPNPLAVVTSSSSLSFETIQTPWFIALVSTVALCVLSVFVRYRRSADVERHQLRWFLYACAIFIATYAGQGLLFIGVDPPSWAGAFLTFAILLLPLSIGVAILRYRLYDIDIIIRRTLVYVPLTAFLAGLFSASIRITQTLFVGVTGGQSEAATVLTTLFVVAAFEPLKRWLQRVVDARFKEGTDPGKRLTEYRKQVAAFLEITDARASATRLLEETTAAFEAESGAIYLQRAEALERVYTIGDWQDAPEATLFLQHNGLTVGRLSLGARRNGRPFAQPDLTLLAEIAGAAAAAIALGARWRSAE